MINSIIIGCLIGVIVTLYTKNVKLKNKLKRHDEYDVDYSIIDASQHLSQFDNNLKSLLDDKTFLIKGVKFKCIDVLGSEITIKNIDDSDKTYVISFLNEWSNMVFGFGGRMVMKSEIVKDIETECGCVGLYNAFPKSLDISDVDNNEIEFTLVFDYFEEK